MSFRFLAVPALMIWISGCRTGEIEPEFHDLPLKLDGGQLSRNQKVESAKRAAKLGWDAFYQKNYELAAHRFNQAWLLDARNYNALWGMGVLSGQRALADNYKSNIKEAVRFLEMAYKRFKRNARLNADLANAHRLYAALLLKEQGDWSKYMENMNEDVASHIEKAEALFFDSYNRNSSDGAMLVNFINFCFLIEDYELAARLVREAGSLGINLPDYMFYKVDKVLKSKR